MYFNQKHLSGQAQVCFRLRVSERKLLQITAPWKKIDLYENIREQYHFMVIIRYLYSGI